jgi:hypothetical protein
MNLDLDLIHSATGSKVGSRVSSRVNTPPLSALGSPADNVHLAQGSNSTYKHLTAEQQATLSSLISPNPHGLRHPRRAMLRRNESLARMNSTHNASGGNTDKGKMEKTRSRRMAQINPDVKIIDITRQTRGGIGEKKKVVNRGEIFKFDCEGDIVAHTNNIGSSNNGLNNSGDVKRHVKWHATFDRPIEQLIYPSLQRVDNEAYEEKRKVYKQLHGNHELSVGVATSLTNTAGSSSIKPSITSPGIAKSPKSSTQATATSTTAVQPSSAPERHQYSYQENHGIKLDLLPEAANLPSDFMFIHTPKWTVEVSEVKPSSSSSDGNDARSPSHKERKKSTPKGRNRRKTLSTARSTASSDGRKSDRIKTASSTKSNRRKSNFGPLGISQDLEDDDEEEKEEDNEDDNYSLSSHEFESDRRLDEMIQNKQKKHRSAIEEIEEEGERYLREKIKSHYQARIDEEKEAEDELQDSLSPFHDLKKSLYKKEITLPPIVHNPTDNLVSFLPLLFLPSYFPFFLFFPFFSFLSCLSYYSMLNWLNVIIQRKPVEFKLRIIP